MPIKGGMMTHQERKIAEGMALTGDRRFAAMIAGVSPTGGEVVGEVTHWRLPTV